MKISYNFISLVAIGNFNPAIATPYFFNEICGLNLGESTQSTPSDIPVLKGLKFNDLELIIDLERFNIKESNIRDIHDTKVIDIFKAYYNKLPYTPLKIAGVNINCELFHENKSIFSRVTERVKDPASYLEFFSTDEISVTEDSLCKKDEKVWMSINVRIENVRSLTRLINIVNLGENSLRFNYNYETGNLAQEISRLELLLNEYNEFCKEFLGFVKYLEG